MADGDTGYGSPMNVKRTVESFARAGAAGIMIEDQTWPKRKSNLSAYHHRQILLD
jgi:methylisocitrate lyase